MMLRGMLDEPVVVLRVHPSLLYRVAVSSSIKFVNKSGRRWESHQGIVLVDSQPKS